MYLACISCEWTYASASINTCPCALTRDAYIHMNIHTCTRVLTHEELAQLLREQLPESPIVTFHFKRAQQVHVVVAHFGSEHREQFGQILENANLDLHSVACTCA